MPKVCPNCGASGIVHGLFGTEPVIREMSTHFHCVKCGHEWEKTSKSKTPSHL